MQKCPFCAEEIQEQAIKCNRCGEMLGADAVRWAAAASRFERMEPEQKSREWNNLTLAQRDYLVTRFRVTPPQPVIDPRTPHAASSMLTGNQSMSEQRWYQSKKTTIAMMFFLLLIVFLVVPKMFQQGSREKGQSAQSEAPQSAILPHSEPEKQFSQSNILRVNVPERELLCIIFSCKPNPFVQVTKTKQRGQFEYYEFSRGNPAPEIATKSGNLQFEMYNREYSKPVEPPKSIEYDESWCEKVYADMDANNRLSKADKIADLTSTYWKNNSFLLSITYSAADLLKVPFSVIQRDGKPTPFERFAYLSLNKISLVRDMRDWGDIQRVLDNGEWLVVDSIRDRLWFDKAVSELRLSPASQRLP